MTELYIQEMAPIVKMSEINLITGVHEKRNASILTWYENFHEKILSPNTEQSRKYREELFGPAPIEFTPTLYADYSFYKAMGITEDDFNALDIHTRARMRAHYFLSNIVELREAHLKLQEQKRKELEERAKRKEGKRGAA